jgi:thermitase
MMEYVKKCVCVWMVWVALVAVPEHNCFGQPNVPVQGGDKPGFRAGEIIVKIRDELPSVSRGMTMNIMDTGSRNLNMLNQQFGVTKVEPVFKSRSGRKLLQDSRLSNVLLLNLREDVEETTALQAYTSLEEVEYAELNYLYYIFVTPNDSFFSSQYALYSPSYQGIDAVGGWDIEQGNNSIIVAIIDTGIDYTHEDLTGKVIRGYDFVNEDYDPRDDHGHGTHVAGVAGATANNGRGIAGVCPGCSLLAIKVVSANGSGDNASIANGIANAVSHGAQVINLSLGGLDRSSTIKLAVEQAYQSGAVIVAASGNDGSGVPLYPAAFSEVIAVGATDRYGDRASFSNYGSHLELAAPGQSIYSTLPGNSYEAWNGTSMACPHAAGLAGLLLSQDPTLTNQQVRQLMAATAQDLGSAGLDSYFGYGRINAYSALTQTPGSGGNYPVPTPGPDPYPTPSPGYTPLCGSGMEGVFAMALVGLCWVNIERWKRKK